MVVNVETMDISYYPEQEKVTARNILRRAEITRLTQNLKSRLALATFKTQRGLQNVGLDSIERYAEQQRKEKGQTTSLPPLPPSQHRAHFTPTPKREFEGLQQGFTPSEVPEHNTSHVNGNRKRARTFDTGAQLSFSAPTSMPAPSHIPTSHSFPSQMDQAQQQMQPMIQLNSSPERYNTGAINGHLEPQTPPQRKTVNDDANLLLFLATSPGRGSISPRTPGRDINFNEYLNLFTPSPQVNRQVDLSNIDSARKKLTFE